eukprot:m.176333 g.176333  ORF g.176333 m.176333 type:complete len:528 (-) comp16798_c0_seq5:861-2444(-)
MALSYSNKVMLAPMVRGGTLPTRLLALKYGAQVVYGEELIDFRMLECERVVNPVLDTIDFISKADHSVAFRTCAAEKDAVVFQMGTSDPERAVRVAKLVESDVAGIDVNMGCPKPFSLKGGMGAALLKEPDRAAAIMTALVQACTKPVTCKIRILPTLEETVALAKQLEATGIQALGLHGRITPQRPREPINEYQYSIMQAVAKELTIPVIANGGSLDFKSYQDLITFRDQCQASSVMVARGAQTNMSIFNPEGLSEQLSVSTHYLELAIRYDNTLANTKYNLTKGLTAKAHSKRCKDTHDCSTMRDLAAMYGLTAVLEEQEARVAKLQEEHGFTLHATSIVDIEFSLHSHSYDTFSVFLYLMIGVALPHPCQALSLLVMLFAVDQEDEVAGTVLAHLARRDVDDNDAVAAGEPASKQAKQDPNIVMMKIEYKRKYGRPAPPKAKIHEYCTMHKLDQPTCISTEVDRRFYAICTWLGQQYSTSVSCKSRKDAEHAACLVALLSRGLAHAKEGEEGYDYVNFRTSILK